MIAPTRIGRGALGLRSALYDFDAFADQTYSRKLAYLELQGGKRLAGWSAFGETPVYRVEVAEEWDGVTLDVSGVITQDEVLTRTETLDILVDTVGTFFYDRDGEFLYVHLTDESDPNSKNPVALFSFYFATRGTVEPILGPEKLTDPGLNVVGFPDWDEVSADATVSQDTDRQEGAYSVRVDNVALAAGAICGIEQGPIFGVPGKQYFFTGRYRTSWPLNTIGAEARLRVSADGGTNFLNDDGLTVTASGDGFALLPTFGEWRRFLFAFRCPTDGFLPDPTTADIVVGVFLGNNAGSAITDETIHVNFDDLHLFRVWHYAYFEPRLSADGLPELQRTANDLWFGSESVGLGNVRLLNRDDTRDAVPYLETMLGRYEVCSRTVTLRYGGALMNGQDIPYDNTEPGWSGVVHAFEVGALSADLGIESVRGILSAALPFTAYNDIDNPNLAEADNGRPRPLVFGSITNVRPAMTDVTVDGLGVYETQDPTYSPGDLVLPSAVYAYEDEDAAAVKDATRRVALVLGTDYDSDSYETTARVLMLGNPGPVRITAGENDAIDFFVTGTGTPSVFLTPGLYTWFALMDHVAAVMNAATAPGTITTAYDISTGVVTIATTDVELRLLVDSGDNKERSAYKTLGYSQTADLVGDVTYDAETPIDQDPEAQVIRCDITGMRDDLAGTYTGTPSANIELGPDITRVILRRIVRVAVALILDDRFNDGRTTSPQVLGVYIGGLASVQGGEGSDDTLQGVLDKLEVSCYADINVDNAGRWDWSPRIDDVSGYAATIATVLSNADFLEFSGARTLEDVFHIVRLNYGQDPSTGVVRTAEVTNPLVPVLYDRRHSKTWDSYLLDPDDAADIVLKLSRAAAIAVNRYQFTVKGKMLKVRLGDIVDVSARLRKLAEPEQQSEPYLIRLTSLSVNPLTHVAAAIGYTQFFGVAV